MQIKTFLLPKIRQVGKTSYLLLSLLLIAMFSSCEKEKKEFGTGPLDNIGNGRNKIVVISDLHLGADLAYAEINNNIESLVKLLSEIRESSGVKELVIAGDLLDEWFVPATIDTYKGKDQKDFVQRIATANQGVINAFNQIIKDGKIKVTYVPGNHDLTITSANIDAILPGIQQARDEHLGLGTYSPAGYSQIAIEHGHRYNFFCAPDPYSNQDIAPGTIMPPGYFFTRIAALHVAQKCTIMGDVLPIVTQNVLGSVSQSLMYWYWKDWEWTLKAFPIENKFDEKMIITNVDGFTETYSVNDLLPYQASEGGNIDVKLFKGIQDKWTERQAYNNVLAYIPAEQAIKNAAVSTETDNQAVAQYFLNPNSDKRIVVFGHTHVAKIESSINHNGKKSIYANSGTWIDHNKIGTTMDFVIIAPQNNDTDSQTLVTLYNFANETITKVKEDFVKL